MPDFKALIHNLTRPKNQTNLIGAPSFRVKNPYVLDCYDNDNYASIFPSVKAIANEFMKIQPYATDANGEPKNNIPALDALYRPNKLDSSVSFREKLAVMNLTHRYTYLLVWRNEGGTARPGGELRANNIAGYTFLEDPSITRRDNKTYYSMGAQEFTEDEVIAIPGGVDPNNLYGGYAPGFSSRRWATLDQYIADFQKGFFENGAVPAGQFIITASSKTDYDDTVDKLQQAHRGSGKNNNVTYTPRPVDPETGKPGDSKIEWVPFQESNKDMDFKTLFEQAEKRIDSTFGVPASIRGVGENNNYATARLDQQNFIRFTIEPLALRIYTQITHELNRITNGFGAQITFKLDYPAVAEEEKVQAETKAVEVATILTLTDRGFGLDSIIDALKLSNAYKNLELGDVKTTIINDKPDVDEGGEVNGSPDPTKIDGVTPLNKGGSKGANPKAALSDEERIERISRDYMSAQIERVIVENREEASASNQVVPTQTDEELQAFINAVFAVVSGVLIEQGESEYALALAAALKAGIDITDLAGYSVTETASERYLGYLRTVGISYGSDTADSIRRVLADANAQGLLRKDLEANLRNILQTDDYRVKRMGVTEINHSTSIAKVDAYRQLQAQTGTEWEKSLYHPNGGECEYCRALEGVWFPVDQPLIAYGESVIGDEGGILINNFFDNDGYDPHPNGEGVPIFRRSQVNAVSNSAEYRVHNQTDAHEIKCTDCGRFLATVEQSTEITLKCSNSSCKALKKYKIELATDMVKGEHSHDIKQ